MLLIKYHIKIIIVIIWNAITVVLMISWELISIIIIHTIGYNYNSNNFVYRSWY